MSEEWHYVWDELPPLSDDPEMREHNLSIPVEGIIDGTIHSPVFLMLDRFFFSPFGRPEWLDTKTYSDLIAWRRIVIPDDLKREPEKDFFFGPPSRSQKWTFQHIVKKIKELNDEIEKLRSKG
jgi:hypothetical protein